MQTVLKFEVKKTPPTLPSNRGDNNGCHFLTDLRPTSPHRDSGCWKNKIISVKKTAECLAWGKQLIKVSVIRAITEHTLRRLYAGDSAYPEYCLHRPKPACMTADKCQIRFLWMTVTGSVLSQVLEGNNRLTDELEKWWLRGCMNRLRESARL